MWSVSISVARLLGSMRQHLDTYFESMATYWSNFKSALVVVEDYTKWPGSTVLSMRVYENQWPS